MYKSIILPSAKREIREAAKWYNNRQKGLGKKFTAQVRKKLTHIKQNPFAYSIRKGKTRTAVLHVFPFMVHFTIEENHTVVIASVLHTSRSPIIWPDME